MEQPGPAQERLGEGLLEGAAELAEIGALRRHGGAVDPRQGARQHNRVRGDGRPQGPRGDRVRAQDQGSPGGEDDNGSGGGGGGGLPNTESICERRSDPSFLPRTSKKSMPMPNAV